MKTLLRLQHYMKGRKALLPCAMIFSFLSSIVGVLPFIFVWMIVQILFANTSYDQSLVYRYAYAAVICSVLSIILYYLSLCFSHLSAFRMESNMRKIAMARVVRMPLGFFDKHTSGKIRKVIDDNASITHSFLAHQLPDLAASITIPILITAIMFYFDWRLGLVCFLPMISSLSIMALMMNSSGKKFMISYMNSLEEMNTQAVEYIRGIPVLKVFQQSVYSFKNFHASIIRYKDIVLEYTRLWEKPMSLYVVLINSFVYFLVPVSILLISYGGSTANILLNLFFYVLISPLFSKSIVRSMYLNDAMSQASQAIDRLDELLDQKQMPISNDTQSIKSNNIVFDNVSFTYPGADKAAVDGLSFCVKQGSTLALVGASGSGKTSIARLISRFWDVDKGKISISGVDVRSIEPKELMSNISFVFQDAKLFKTTILNNILYAKPNASMEEVNRAVDLAQCRDIINKLPMGLDTIIGSKGTYLSGGEQQRISLARAILKDSPIVILDEATAFADPENEHLILKAFDKLTEGKTLILIAHRLSSVVDADNIILLNEGSILEQGRHDDLLRKAGSYSKMWIEYNESIKWTIKKEVCNA